MLDSGRLKKGRAGGRTGCHSGVDAHMYFEKGVMVANG